MEMDKLAEELAEELEKRSWRREEEVGERWRKGEDQLVSRNGGEREVILQLL